jgi:hypothetical protein
MSTNGIGTHPYKERKDEAICYPDLTVGARLCRAFGALSD